MKKTLSHSAWKKYVTCPKMYEYHYIQRLRPGGSGSPLYFGSAIDAALNDLLINKDLDLAIQIFRDNFKQEDMPNIVYDYKDFDPRLLPGEEITNDFNSNAWKSMRVKGRIMLEGYYKQVLPLIEEVYHVQKELHTRSGVLDAVVKLRGHGRVLLDHKTSARPYGPDAVTSDTQLALYASDQGLTKAGFVVLIKEIDCQTVRTCTTCKFDGSLVKHKTCPNIINGSRCHGAWDEQYSPQARIQILIDDIPEINKELINTSLSQVEKGIAASIYPMNLGACGKMYGRPCPYINKCWRNDETGLEYVKEKTKENK